MHVERIHACHNHVITIFAIGQSCSDPFFGKWSANGAAAPANPLLVEAINAYGIKNVVMCAVNEGKGGLSGSYCVQRGRYATQLCE